MTAPLQFTQVREDPLIDLEVLALTPAGDRRALIVASGGCTALSLLTDPTVAGVDAVDINPTQIALCRLKAAAVAALDLADYRVFLGIDAGDPLALWPAVAAELSPEPRRFWQQHRGWIAEGLQEAGNYEKLFALWRRYLHSFVHPPAGLQSLFDAPSLAGQRAVFAGFHAGYWPVGFQLAFHHDFLDVMFTPRATQHAVRPYPVYFEGVFRRAICDLPARNNYFLSQLLLGTYLPVPDGVPPYLSPEGYGRVKERLGRLRFHDATFPGFLADRQGPPYAYVQLSNIGDWLGREEKEAICQALIPHLQPGGRVLIRQLNNDEPLPQALTAIGSCDPALDRALQARERSFFYEQVRAMAVIG